MRELPAVRPDEKAIVGFRDDVDEIRDADDAPLGRSRGTLIHSSMQRHVIVP